MLSPTVYIDFVLIVCLHNDGSSALLPCQAANIAICVVMFHFYTRTTYKQFPSRYAPSAVCPNNKFPSLERSS